MRIDLRRTLLFSVLAHAVILFLIWRRPPRPAPPVEIQLVERTVPKVQAQGNFKSIGRRSHGRHAAGLQAFVPEFGPVRGAGWKNDFTAGSDDTGPLEPDWGSHGGKFGEVERQVKYDRLFQEIEGLLYFPGRLGEHDMEGTVNVRLSFDGNSHCDWSRSRVEGAPPYLRFYILALVKKLCAFETIEHIRLRDRQFVDLSFAFRIIREPEPPARIPREYIQGNVLAFDRTFVRPALQYRLGPLTGSFLTPMVFLNFPWIVEHYEQYIQGKDPLDEFKD